MSTSHSSDLICAYTKYKRDVRLLEHSRHRQWFQSMKKQEKLLLAYESEVMKATLLDKGIFTQLNDDLNELDHHTSEVEDELHSFNESCACDRQHVLDRLQRMEERVGETSVGEPEEYYYESSCLMTSDGSVRSVTISTDDSQRSGNMTSDESLPTEPISMISEGTLLSATDEYFSPRPFRLSHSSKRKSEQNSDDTYDFAEISQISDFSTCFDITNDLSHQNNTRRMSNRSVLSLHNFTNFPDFPDFPENIQYSAEQSLFDLALSNSFQSNDRSVKRRRLATNWSRLSAESFITEMPENMRVPLGMAVNVTRQSTKLEAPIVVCDEQITNTHIDLSSIYTDDDSNAMSVDSGNQSADLPSEKSVSFDLHNHEVPVVSSGLRQFFQPNDKQEPEISDFMIPSQWILEGVKPSVPVTPGRSYVCPLQCNKTFRRFVSLKHHLKKSICVRKTAEKMNNKGNNGEKKQLSQSRKQSDKLVRATACLICRKKYRTPTQLRTHMDVHLRSSSFVLELER